MEFKLRSGLVLGLLAVAHPSSFALGMRCKADVATNVSSSSGYYVGYCSPTQGLADSQTCDCAAKSDSNGIWSVDIKCTTEESVEETHTVTFNSGTTSASILGCTKEN